MSCNNISVEGCLTSSNPPTNRLVSFSASFSLEGDYSASATFLDPNCEDDPYCEILCNPIKITVPTTLEKKPTLNATMWEKCYSCNPPWVYGLMRSYSKSYDEFQTSVNVVHFSDYLKNKAIDSQQFGNATLSEVFPIIFNYYAGLNDDFYSINSFTNNFILGPVSGTSIFDELRALAQAGNAHMFVQTDGKLTIEKWKDHNSATDYEIPPELIISVERGEYSKPDTSMIKISGASILGTTCAQSEISNNNLGQSALKKCVIAGRETPVVKLTFNNLNGDNEDIKTTTVQGDINQDGDNKENVGPGSFTANFRKNNLDWFGPDPSVVNLSLTNKSRSNRDEAIFGRKQLIKDTKAQRHIQNKIQRVIARNFPVPKSGFNLGAYGEPVLENANTNVDNQRTEAAYAEVSTFIYKGNAFGSDCGISMETINNKYVVDPEVLFSLGLRRFQEIDMSQAVYNLTLPYMPCIQLNQVIEFAIPESCCDPKRIRAIVQEIQIDGSVDSETGAIDITMKVAVTSIECLGKTTYTSGNLVRNYCTDIAQTTGINGWQTAALNLEQASGFDGTCAYIWAKNGRYVRLRYSHLLDLNAQYNLTFDYRNLIGNDASTAVFSAGFLGSTAIPGSATYATNFTPLVSWVDFEWALVSPLNLHYLKICNLLLVKTVLG